MKEKEPYDPEGPCKCGHVRARHCGHRLHSGRCRPGYTDGEWLYCECLHFVSLGKKLPMNKRYSWDFTLYADCKGN